MTGAGRTVAVIGGNGQLGSDLVAEFARRGWNAVPLTHADIQVEDAESVASVLGGLKPALVLNTAAFHVVTACEAQPDVAHRVNALGALHVAREAKSLGAINVYFSTDYVFDGTKMAPYVETDPTCPLNVYGATKVAGEGFTLEAGGAALVARVSGLYGAVPCRAKGSNFVTSMIRAAAEQPEVRVVADEIITPTATVAAARAVANAVDAGGRGVFHMTCEGQCSWFDFARAIFEALGLRTPLVPTSVADAPPAVRRPHYSVLDNAGMRGLGVSAMPEWDVALGAFLSSPR